MIVRHRFKSRSSLKSPRLTTMRLRMSELAEKRVDSSNPMDYNYSKIIFSSADNSIKEEALAMGAVDFQAKPYDLELLVENIQRILHI